MSSTLLIRAPDRVGELVMATPVFAAALESPRYERVRIAVEADLTPVLEGSRWAEHLLLVERGGSEVRTLRSAGADAALLLDESSGAAWRGWRAGIPIRAGVSSGWRRPFLTHRVVPARRAGRRWPVPTAHLYRDLAGLVGLEVADLHPRLAVSDERRARARAALARVGVVGEPYLVCCPGAAFGSSGLWPPERFAAAIDQASELHGLRAVVTGAPTEAGVVEAILRHTRTDAVAPPEGDLGLANLSAWIEGARLLLAGDSGPRWVAAAFDVPCVHVMGPEPPQLTASSLEQARIVRRDDLPCSPCSESRCPLGHRACMTELPVERVVDAATELLAEANA